MGIGDCQGKEAGMIIVKGDVRFGDGEIARLKDEFEAMIAATRAEAGCAAYNYAVDLRDPNLLLVAEEWASEAAMDEHMQTPHMARLGAALATAKIEAIRIDAYQGHYLKNVMGGDPPPAD
jgi:quinol monooxygenase YgiN